MSQHYEMNILVKGFDPAKKHNIAFAIEAEWNISDSWEQDGGTMYTGEGNLSAETDSEFAQHVSHAVWKANGTFCEVEVRSVYLENPPTDYFTFDEDDYEKWRKTNVEEDDYEKWKKTNVEEPAP